MSKLKHFFEEAEQGLFIDNAGSVSAEQLFLEANEHLRECENYRDISARLDDIAIGLEEAIDYLEEQDSLGASEAAVIADPLLSQIGEDEELAASLESVSDGQEVLDVTLESLSGKLRDAIKAIIKAVLNAIDAIRAFFRRLMGGFGKIGTHAQKLKAEVKKLDFKGDVSEITVRNPRVISYEGGVSREGIVAGSKNLAEVVKEFTGPWIDSLVKWYPLTSKAINSMIVFYSKGNDLPTRDGALKHLGEAFSPTAVTANPKVMTMTILGDKQFVEHAGDAGKDKEPPVLTTFDDGEALNVIVTQKPPKLVDADVNLVKEVETTMTPLQKQDVIDILDNVIGISNAMLKNYRDVEKVNRARKSTLDAFSKLAKAKMKAKTDGADKDAVGGLDVGWRMIRSSIQQDMLAPVTDLSKHSFNTSRRLLDLAARHIELYRKVS